MAKKGVNKKWQPCSRSQRLNVLGFMRADDGLNKDSVTIYEFEGRIDANVITACFETLSTRVTQETWVIIDNAPQHTSRRFKSYLPSWAERGLHVKYLPPYSPELNKIEILWRLIKYQWLKYQLGWTISDLKKSIDDIIIGIGTKYQINFS